MEDIVDILSHHGIRPTANRITIAKALASSETPLSMVELEAELDTIDKSNIFRTLTLFRENHLVHAFEDGGDGVRYEFCHSHHDDEDDDLHAHFYCEKCHKTTCLKEIPVPQTKLPEGYRESSVNYVIKGICPSCQR